MTERPAFTRAAGVAAWLVHLLTAAGAAVGLLALVAVHEADLKRAFCWLALAAVIDGLDGPLARILAVSTHAPNVDGSLLDNLVDYLNYVVVPALILIGFLPSGIGIGVAAAVCIASAFQFAHVEAKSAVGFRGFPSTWNVVALYAWLFPWSAGTTLALVSIGCALVFVPVQYVHPIRTPTWRPVTLTLTGLWAATMGYLLFSASAGSRVPIDSTALRGVLVLSLIFPAYYFALSLWLSMKAVMMAGHSGSRR